MQYTIFKANRKRRNSDIIETVRTMGTLMNGDSGLNKTVPGQTGCDPSSDPNWVTALLTISLTVQGCTLCFLLTRAVLDHLTTKKPTKTWDKIANLHKRQNWMLPKIFTEQFLTWALNLAALTEIIRRDLITCPFVPKVSRDLTVCRTILCINIGRYLYKCAQDILLHPYCLRLKVDLLHHIVTLSCYTVFVWSNENLLLGLVGVLMESDVILHESSRVAKAMGFNMNSPRLKAFQIITAAMTLVWRGTIPTLFVIVSLVNQDVMSMHFVSILFLFLGLVFFGAFSVWAIAQAGLRLRRTFLGHPLSVNLAGAEEAPPVGERQRDQGRPSSSVIPTPSAESTKSKRPLSLNYKNDMCYLSPFSNVNINSSVKNSKYNLINKKLTPKDNMNNIELLLKGKKSALVNNGAGICVLPMPTPVTSGARGESYSTAVVAERSDQVSVETRLDETRVGVHHVILSGECSGLSTSGHRVHCQAKPRPFVSSRGLHP